jgi:hypothetical protein
VYFMYFTFFCRTKYINPAKRNHQSRDFPTTNNRQILPTKRSSCNHSLYGRLNSLPSTQIILLSVHQSIRHRSIPSSVHPVIGSSGYRSISSSVRLFACPSVYLRWEEVGQRSRASFAGRSSSTSQRIIATCLSVVRVLVTVLCAKSGRHTLSSLSGKDSFLTKAV